MQVQVGLGQLTERTWHLHMVPYPHRPAAVIALNPAASPRVGEGRKGILA
ncbi:hypothetical protein Pve01_12820 [Planomonospora venezuelensis]|nr:hypothetical protein Pve01_12820 [Planomonospora venezuelensis]